jgi:hypothetical protein
VGLTSPLGRYEAWPTFPKQDLARRDVALRYLQANALAHIEAQRPEQVEACLFRVPFGDRHHHQHGHIPHRSQAQQFLLRRPHMDLVVVEEGKRICHKKTHLWLLEALEKTKRRAWLKIYQDKVPELLKANKPSGETQDHLCVHPESP